MQSICLFLKMSKNCAGGNVYKGKVERFEQVCTLTNQVGRVVGAVDVVEVPNRTRLFTPGHCSQFGGNFWRISRNSSKKKKN